MKCAGEGAAPDKATDAAPCVIQATSLLMQLVGRDRVMTDLKFDISL
jgi:hypothetical protein